MTDSTPKTEVMSRAGRGTVSAWKAGNTKPYRRGDAKRYLSKGKGWFWLATDELDAEFGAPTSGGPPYAVYEITPTVAFGLPTDGEKFAPTRWRFGG